MEKLWSLPPPPPPPGSEEPPKGPVLIGLRYCKYFLGNHRSRRRSFACEVLETLRKSQRRLRRRRISQICYICACVSRSFPYFSRCARSRGRKNQSLALCSRRERKNFKNGCNTKQTKVIN